MKIYACYCRVISGNGEAIYQDDVTKDQSGVVQIEIKEDKTKLKTSTTEQEPKEIEKEMDRD